LPVPGLTGVVEVATGGGHTCALLAGGTVWCWGNNGNGQVGSGAVPGSFSATPVPVPGLTDVSAIAAGGESTCALVAGGTVECWGFDGYGQLGDGTMADSAAPVPVSNLVGVTAITAGDSTACALLANGTVECWGIDNDGELGVGTTTGPAICPGTSVPQPCSTTPLPVPGVTGVTAISAGYEAVCAVLSGGAIDCWGANSNGELGNGTMTGSATPVRVASLSGVLAISVGFENACALVAGGKVECWGATIGLGNGTTSGSATPVPVSGF
jgi:alpha-tubulin suppressor-like RCC1 family protein